MLEYRKEKTNEMIRDSLRAVTGWEGPIVAREHKFIFYNPDGIPAFETDREHAQHVREEVDAKGGTYQVIHKIVRRSTLNILARRVP